MRPGRLLYAGAVGPTAPHAHHAFQLVVGLGGPVGIVDGKGDAIRAKAAVIPPDAPHSITVHATSALMLYVDPDDRAGRSLRRALEGVRSSGRWAEAGTPLKSESLALPETWDDFVRLEMTMIEALAGTTARPKPVHPAVTRALRAVSGNLDGDVSLPAIAVHAGVSAGRLSHLFSEEVGIPLRPYVLWMRMSRAAEHLQRGAALTEAAHAGGFSDSAHLNRVFRRMFGLAPSEASRGVEWVTPPPSSSR